MGSIGAEIRHGRADCEVQQDAIPRLELAVLGFHRDKVRALVVHEPWQRNTASVLEIDLEMLVLQLLQLLVARSGTTQFLAVLVERHGSRLVDVSVLRANDEPPLWHGGEGAEGHEVKLVLAASCFWKSNVCLQHVLGAVRTSTTRPVEHGTDDLSEVGPAVLIGVRCEQDADGLERVPRAVSQLRLRHAVVAPGEVAFLVDIVLRDVLPEDEAPPPWADGDDAAAGVHNHRVDTWRYLQIVEELLTQGCHVHVQGKGAHGKMVRVQCHLRSHGHELLPAPGFPVRPRVPLVHRAELARAFEELVEVSWVDHVPVGAAETHGGGIAAAERSGKLHEDRGVVAPVAQALLHASTEVEPLGLGVVLRGPEHRGIPEAFVDRIPVIESDLLDAAQHLDLAAGVPVRRARAPRLREDQELPPVGRGVVQVANAPCTVSGAFPQGREPGHFA
mmetsp:Transcript_67596/g.218289  ORF Transcript_67596/g.218289 Transcript_67596/m.218289 type:complete len:447 (+) Transcript_67596:1230-2570(+)